jgi:hypothetical protein
MQGGPGYWFPQLIVVLPFSCNYLVISSPMRCGCGSLEPALSFREQLYSSLFILLWKWLFAVLIYWDFQAGGLFLCPAPFLWDRFSVPSASLCCQYFMMVHWLIFNFVGQFDFGCCSLGQMNSLLPCFRVAYCLPSLNLPAYPAFVYWKFMLRLTLSSPHFSGAQSTFPPPLLLY